MLSFDASMAHTCEDLRWIFKVLCQAAAACSFLKHSMAWENLNPINAKSPRTTSALALFSGKKSQASLVYQKT